jgi:3-keto-L-gulonate-6-phosphate decarboxylase
MILNSRKKYLQMALNSTLEEARSIIFQLPPSDRILIEAGTPLIKAYGGHAIRQIRKWADQKFFLSDTNAGLRQTGDLFGMAEEFLAGNLPVPNYPPREKIISKNREAEFQNPYIVADLKTMDRGNREAEIAARNGASAAVALGLAPIETIDSFISSCDSYDIDSMVDMMNVEYPLAILRKLKKIPDVVILHRGVDEEKFNKEKMIPLHEIRRVKGAYNMMISVAGGDTIREVQRAIFNDADIVVVWKEFYQKTADTAALAKKFLEEIK